MTSSIISKLRIFPVTVSIDKTTLNQTRLLQFLPNPVQSVQVRQLEKENNY